MSERQFVSRGRALVDRRQFQEAVKVCRLGLLASPTEVEGRLVLASALVALHRYDEVLAEMRVALELEPANTTALVIKAEALLCKGDALQAREILEHACSLGARDPRTEALLGEANDVLGAVGKPNRRAAGTFGDEQGQFTKHYPAHLGVGTSAEPGSGHRAGPHAPAPRLAASDSAAAIEPDPAHDAYEVVGRGARGGDAGTIELQTGDVELLPASDALPPSVDPLAPDFTDAEEPTAFDPHPPFAAVPFVSASPPTSSESPFGSRRQATGPGDVDAAQLDELFPEEASGVSKLELRPGSSSGSLELRPAQERSLEPRQVQIDGPAMPMRESAPAPAPHTPSPQTNAQGPPRSQTQDMDLIKQGLGIEDTGSSRGFRRGLCGLTGSVSARGAALRARRGFLLSAYALTAAVVLAGAVFAGLQVRDARLDRQIGRAMRDAERVAADDTLTGYRHAIAAYERMRAVRDDVEVEAARARALAAVAAEYGGDRNSARTAVEALGGATRPDAIAARGYLALAEAKPAKVAEHAAALLEAAPDAAIGHYLTGRAALLAGDAAAAANAFREALARQPSPLAYVGLARAHAAQGGYAEAFAALDGATTIVESFPAAVMERARIQVESGELPAEDELEGALQALAGGKAVSPPQAAWASLIIARARIARGDPAGARAAIEQALAAPPSDDALFSESLIAGYLALGELASARNEAARAVETWPQRPGAHVRMAQVELASGNPADALASLANIADLAAMPAALAARGQARLAMGEHQAAKRDLDAALAAQPGLRAAQLARAQVDLHGGDTRGAVARLAPLYDATPTPDLGVVYASALRLNGERESARGVLESVLENAGTSDAYLELARLDRDEGKFRDARAAYARAIEVDPQGVEPRLEAAMLALDVGDAKGAREALDALAAEVGQHGRALAAAAQVRTLTGDPEGASALLDQADRADMTPRWLISRERGRVALRTQRFSDAVTELERAVSLQPGDGETRLLLIEALVRAEDGAGAARALADVVEKFSGQPEADFALGRVHLYNDRPNDAMAALKAARDAITKADAAPREQANARYWIGRVHYYEGDLDDAKDVLGQAVELDPSHADAWFLLAQVELERGKLARALHAYEKSVEADPVGNPDAWFYLGEVAFNSRERKKARTALQTYVDGWPEGPFASEAKAYLAKM